MSATTWILNSQIVTQNEKRKIYSKAHLKIQDGVIQKITTVKPKISKSTTNTKVVDGSGLTLFPGFVQTHIHLCQTLFRNLADDLELLDWLKKRIWKFEALHTAESLALSADIGIRELLMGGTTTLLDMATVRHTEQVIQTAIRLGIRANIGKCLMDHPKNTPPYLRESREEAMNETASLFKRYHRTYNDRIRISLAPRFALSCTQELLEDVAIAQKKTGALIHTHACENQNEILAIKKSTGFNSNLEYLKKCGVLGENTVLAHCVWLSRKETSLLKRSKATVSHCPSSNLKLASGIAPVFELLQQKIRVSLGADGAPCNNSLDALREMRLAGMLQKAKHGPKALPAQTLLDLATREGAKALDWFDQIGSIEEGKQADLFAVDLSSPFCLGETDPVSALIYSTDRSQIEWTMVSGECVYEKKDPDFSKILKTLSAQAVSERTRILRKVRAN